MRIGKRIRMLRKEKGMTLEELSQKSGVALATLSRMENNKMTGTLASHRSICKALGISIVEIHHELEDKSKPIKAIPKTRQTEHFDHTCKTRYELLIENTHNKKIMPLMIKLGAGGKTPEEKNKPGVEKFMHVVKGTLEAVIGEETFTLKQGDSLYFDASLPHLFRNKAKTETKVMCIISPSEA